MQNNLVTGDQPLYMLVFFLLTIGFTFFYVQITFNPEEVSDNMKQYGGFVPGIRAGRPTAEYLNYVLTRITSAGSLYLGLIALHPADRAGLLRGQPELPVRRRIDPDYRGRGPRDRQADRRTAAAAPLRRASQVTETTTRLLIIGPPGAGKGTQAAQIAARFDIPAISTGDIFRANIKGGTPLGQQVQAIIERGELVPDSLTNEIVADRLAQADAARGFLLDGYPRNVEQVHALDGMIEGDALDAVVLLEVDTDAVVSRLLKRAELEGRADDTEEVIRHRQNVYAEQTAPLVELFAERGILVSVDGLGTVEEVAERIAAGLTAQLSAKASR